MEVNKERELKSSSEKFDVLKEAASMQRTSRKDTFNIPAWRFGSKSWTTIQPEDDKDEPQNAARQPGETISKKQSLSCDFIVNINDPINNISMNINESETGCVLSRETTSPPEDPSQVKRLQATSCKYGAMVQSLQASTEDPGSNKWTRLQIERTSPISLKFEDVKYKIVEKGATKYILHGITGSVDPGQVLALMGPSGDGKTTLLNLLSGRVNSNCGTITYNDSPYTKSLRRRIGFVTQDDVVLPHLTVKETLTYAALLRLPNILTRQQKKERAMNIITELGLERCQNTLIGGNFVRGISGGERKRVCIGNEILLNPSLLFLDEPTSGLDSTTALLIIQMLQNIAQAGKTVVTTIHQPSSRLFSKFDKLILLGRGNSLYSGKASEAMVYFSSIGCYPLIAMNPAEFLIDLANGNMDDKSIPSELEDKQLLIEARDIKPSHADVHEYLTEAYKTRISKAKKANPKPLEPLPRSKVNKQGKLNSQEFEATWWEQFTILLRRSFKERRHEYFSLVRVTQVVATAIIVGLLWWHPGSSSPKQPQDQAGLLFFITVFWGYFPLFAAIFTFPQERAILAKEASVGMYRLSAYFTARTISDLPLDLILPVVFMVTVYFMVGLKLSFSAFCLTMLTVFLCIVAAQGLGLTIGAAVMDVKKATTLGALVVMAFMLSSGFFLQKVSYFMSWMRYISINYHTYRLLLKIQYTCSGHESGSCQSSFIRGLQLDWGQTEVSAMIVMIVVYRLLAYLFLRRIK